MLLHIAGKIPLVHLDLHLYFNSLILRFWIFFLKKILFKTKTCNSGGKIAASTSHKSHKVINYFVAFKLEVESYVEETSIQVTALKFHFDWHSVRVCKQRKNISIFSFLITFQKKKRVSLEGSDQKPFIVDLKERLFKYFSEKHLKLSVLEKLKNSIFSIYKFV